jgi:hypothetical protein
MLLKISATRTPQGALKFVALIKILSCNKNLFFHGLRSKLPQLFYFIITLLHYYHPASLPSCHLALLTPLHYNYFTSLTSPRFAVIIPRPTSLSSPYCFVSFSTSLPPCFDLTQLHYHLVRCPSSLCCHYPATNSLPSWHYPA